VDPNTPAITTLRGLVYEEVKTGPPIAICIPASSEVAQNPIRVLTRILAAFSTRTATS
jgi:hypothetical protein